MTGDRGGDDSWHPRGVLRHGCVRHRRRDVPRVHGPARGRAVHVAHIKPTSKAPGTKSLKVEPDILLSSVAFNFNLRRYNVAFCLFVALADIDKEVAVEGFHAGRADNDRDAEGGPSVGTTKPGIQRMDSMGNPRCMDDSGTWSESDDSGRGLHSFPFPLNLSLLCQFPLNLRLPCPPCNPN